MSISLEEKILLIKILCVMRKVFLNEPINKEIIGNKEKACLKLLQKIIGSYRGELPWL